MNGPSACTVLGAKRTSTAVSSACAKLTHANGHERRRDAGAEEDKLLDRLDSRNLYGHPGVLRLDDL
jgi:hypothetical protein